ncbi:hypothetical protein BV22DRAFT_1049294 [Leucogyrophana mollusca]|uniref:Uncharacterized protein n=1 Tax=Leucogyrophana mollusca TaxID=85980 RepID=A0ACB8B879_9AGAM|nr:hypothetical protein BV22DRAFT_1049294 [Leucogyrophana mollusca]
MFLEFLGVQVLDVPQLLYALINQTAPPVSGTPPTSGTTEPGTGGQQTETLPPVGTVGAEIQPIRQITRLFALIIGINEYKKPGVNLLGAVPDANVVKDYLEKDLRVPSSQIRNLRNSEATRARIIEEISAFTDDKDKNEDQHIQNGDSIFIFYAGHGAESPSPPGWQARGPNVQHVAPYDYGCEDESAGGTVPGIPDRTLGALLTRLAGAKGDNITVIFDCCHSGSGTRTGHEAPTRLVRDIRIKETPPDDLDQDIWEAVELNEAKNGRAMPRAAGFAQSGLREESGRGVFTTALIDTLKFGVNQVTYAELLQRLPPLPVQNPQCEGVNQNRILFNAKVAGQRAVLYKIRKVGDHYEMDAGEAHGISVSAHFALYKDRDSFLNDSPSLGTVVARKLAPFSTTLDAFPTESILELEGEGVAVQTKAGDEEDLRVHVAMKVDNVIVFEALSKEMQRTDPARREIRLVEYGAADLDIANESGRIVFNVSHLETRALGLTRLWKSVEPTVRAVTPVISAAAHYFWHLRRTSVNKSVKECVGVRFSELAMSNVDGNGSISGGFLRPNGDNLITDNVIDLTFKADAKYGMELTNSSNKALYVSIFYFDSSTLEITPWYQPPTAKGVVDPSILGKGKLPIGYGDSGTPPQELRFRDPGQTFDLGFLKIYISTVAVNLSHIPQETPFGINRRRFKSSPIGVPPIWHTILIPVRLRRTFE